MEAITDYFKSQISTRYKIEAITKYFRKQVSKKYKIEAITNYFKRQLSTRQNESNKNQHLNLQLASVNPDFYRGLWCDVKFVPFSLLYLVSGLKSIGIAASVDLGSGFSCLRQLPFHFHSCKSHFRKESTGKVQENPPKEYATTIIGLCENSN